VMPRRLVSLRPRGLGQVGDSTTTLDYPGIPTDGSVTTLNYPGLPADTSGGGYAIATPINAPSIPSGSGFNWDAWLGNFLNQGVKLAGQVVAPQTTLIRGPGGQLYYQAPASSSGAALPAAGLLSTGGGNWLLIGGAVLVGAVLLSSLGR